MGVIVGEHDTATPIDCVDNTKLGGEVVCLQPIQQIPVEEAIAHPNWQNPPFANDIGLLRLRTPADTDAGMLTF